MDSMFPSRAPERRTDTFFLALTPANARVNSELSFLDSVSGVDRATRWPQSNHWKRQTSLHRSLRSPRLRRAYRLLGVMLIPAGRQAGREQSSVFTLVSAGGIA